MVTVIRSFRTTGELYCSTHGQAGLGTMVIDVQLDALGRTGVHFLGIVSMRRSQISQEVQFEYCLSL